MKKSSHTFNQNVSNRNPAAWLGLLVTVPQLVALLFFIPWLTATAADAEPSASETNLTSLSIDHVSIYPMTEGGGHPLFDMTVLIKGGRITNILSSASDERLEGFRHIDAHGQWLMPSLTDMHVHEENPRLFGLFFGPGVISPRMLNNEDLLLPFVANGVLQIFNPVAMTEEIGLRDDIEAGRILGPHIELAAMVDGNPPVWPVGFSHVAGSPESGRQFVRDMKADGFRFIKTYSKLDLDTFTAIVSEAHALGMKVVGHIPGRKQNATEKWFQPGYDMVMHAEEFAYQSEELSKAQAHIAHYVTLAKERGVLLTSTLTTNERIVEQIKDHDSLKKRTELKYVNPATRFFWSTLNPYAGVPATELPSFEQVVTFNNKLVRAFAASGITVFPGTDTLVPGVIAGFSLHDELEALARAGLSPAQILIADTRLAAEWLGVAADRGTVEIGKRADLLLLEADPMLDVSNTRHIAAVIRDGQYLSKETLDRKMAEMAERYSRMPAIARSAPTHVSGGGGHFGDED